MSDSVKILVLGDKQLVSAITREGYRTTGDPGDDLLCTVSDTVSFRMAPDGVPLIVLLSNNVSDWAAQQERPEAIFKNSLEDVLEYLKQISIKEDIPKIETHNSVLTIAHSNKGGVGKSTAAISMAITLSNMDIPTVLCDFDFFAPDLATFFNIKKKTDRYLEVDISEESLMSSLVKISKTLYVLPWPNIPEVPDIQEKKLVDTLTILRKHFPVIICDTSPASWEHLFIYPLFENADLVFSVVEPHLFSIAEAEKYTPTLLMMGVKPQNIRILINKYNPKLASIKEIEKKFCAGLKKNANKPKVAATIPENTEKVEIALKRGQISNQREWAIACRELVQMLGRDFTMPEVTAQEGGLSKWLRKPWETASAKCRSI